MGRLVLIPFEEGKRSPNGIVQQQHAEQHQEEVLKHASRAIGDMVGLSQSMEAICINKVPERVSYITNHFVDIDDRCTKNYALIICIVEKVTNIIYNHFKYSIMITHYW